ncbi:Uncharacterized conserved protein, DUF2267 family [Micromonospora pattaloongensis]|uniref:Uncharacterized conserved protein, DUF2267 family n=1 Tax=Micromonospora pattaloongensis TaxID=405436 RepID=A0A1H3T7F2_9ACTN|nr:DUF2267 domain-containing protein [Micromonospora pattaloongensis]SDZ45645.1 Uncharacterized conserved protein, DUF2267 family [Micromonospora pattaloongensis]
MTSSQVAVLDGTVEKTNRVLKDIEQAYGWPRERRNQSYLALRAVLHCLRDRLPVGEAVQLSAQLPLLIRGIYYDGWEPDKAPEKMGRSEFLARVREDFRFEIDGGIERLVQTVLTALRPYITDGEWQDVKSSMPKELMSMLPA